MSIPRTLFCLGPLFGGLHVPGSFDPFNASLKYQLIKIHMKKQAAFGCILLREPHFWDVRNLEMPHVVDAEAFLGRSMPKPCCRTRWRLGPRRAPRRCPSSCRPAGFCRVPRPRKSARQRPPESKRVAHVPVSQATPGEARL